MATNGSAVDALSRQAILLGKKRPGPKVHPDSGFKAPTRHEVKMLAKALNK